MNRNDSKFLKERTRSGLIKWMLFMALTSIGRERCLGSATVVGN